MSVTINPTAAEIDAATKPVGINFTATVDFVPVVYEWSIDGVVDYKDSAYSGSGPYTLNGPSLEFSAAPKTISLTVTKSGGSTESASFTTADQRAPDQVAVALHSQEDGVPIVDGVSVPMTPSGYGVPGKQCITLIWSDGAEGQLPQSDVIVKANVRDMDGLDSVSVDWGDGQYYTYSLYGLPEVQVYASHTYNVTGARTIAATPLTQSGTGAAGTLDITIAAAATGYRAAQYRIRRFTSHIGFQDTHPIGWRDFTGSGPRAITTFNVRNTRQSTHMLQLRSVDVTGRPDKTSAYSLPFTVGPW